MKSLCWRKISLTPPYEIFLLKKRAAQINRIIFFFLKGGEQVKMWCIWFFFLSFFSCFLCGFLIQILHFVVTSRASFVVFNFKLRACRRKFEIYIHGHVCRGKRTFEIYIIEMKCDSESRARSSCCPNPAIGFLYSLQIQSLLEMVEASWSRISW